MGLMLNTSVVNIHLISVQENEIFVKRSILVNINMTFPTTKWHLAQIWILMTRIKCKDRPSGCDILAD